MVACNSVKYCHTKKFWVRFQDGDFLCVCMLSISLPGFPPDTSASFHSPKTCMVMCDFKLPLGMNVTVCNSLALNVSPAPPPHPPGIYKETTMSTSVLMLETGFMLIPCLLNYTTISIIFVTLRCRCFSPYHSRNLSTTLL